MSRRVLITPWWPGSCGDRSLSPTLAGLVEEHGLRRAPMWKTRPIWPASAAQAADWPRLAEARGSPEA
eukprot:scaffold84657_cov48-Phaeocystis_antarctica.AAC.1